MKSGVSTGVGTTIVAVAAWVMLPETAVKVRVYVPGAAEEDGARCRTLVVVPAAIVVVQAVSWQRMPLGRDGTESVTVAENPLAGVIWPVKAVGVAPGESVAVAGETARVKVGSPCEWTRG